MLTWFHRLASPKIFYGFAGHLLPWMGAATLLCLIWGLYQGLFVAPPDYQQGESYRIMFIHVPSAWMSLFVYAVMAAASAVGLIWRIKLAEIVAVASAPIGAWFTVLTLVTGSLWGRPMWGTWWVWDARLTSELILLFLYLGYMALYSAIEEPRAAFRAAAILALVGVVNLPIIHFSVQWWNTLHQTSSVSLLGNSSIDWPMLKPLLLMAVAFKLYFFTVLLIRVRVHILERERRTTWVHSLMQEAA